MPLKGAQRLARGYIPQTDGAIEAPGGQRLTILAEHDGADSLGMPLEGLAFAATQVADAGDTIGATAGNALAIGAKGNLINRGARPLRLDARQGPRRSDLPQVDDAVTAGRSEQQSIGTERHRVEC